MGILDPFTRLEATLSSYEASASTSQPSSTSNSTAFFQSYVTQPSIAFIRGANPAQAAVYSKNQLNTDKPAQLEKAELKRKQIALATPLRKGKGGAGRANLNESVVQKKKGRKSKGFNVLNESNDPEVPLRAALKLLDMYPSAASAGLRDDIIDRIQVAQEQAERISEIIQPRKASDGTDSHSDTLKQLEDEVRALEEQYAQIRRKYDDKMRREAAEQDLEGDESMESEVSPSAQRTARMKGGDRSKTPRGLNLGMQTSGGLEDETTDFQGMNLSDASLLIESETPDISQLMAQTPMKLNASGAWDRPTPVAIPAAASGRVGGKSNASQSKSQVPAASTASQPQTKSKPTLASLAMRSRAAAKQPPPPRTPPRRSPDEDNDYTESFEATPRAGYTFDLPQDKSLGTPSEDPKIEHKVTSDNLLDSIDNEEPTVILSKNVLKAPHETETGYDDAEPDIPAATGSPPPANVEHEDEYTQKSSVDGIKDEPTSLDAAKLQEFTTKIWSICGDTLAPGNNYNIGPGTGTEDPPTYLQTRALLYSLTTQPTNPDDSQDRCTQVLTAVLFFHLISKDSSSVEDPADAFSSSMAEVRELLSRATEEREWRRDLGNKIVFMWVPKKILKSEGGRKLRVIL